MKILLPSLLAIILFSCTTAGKFVYDFEMTHPVQSKQLSYQNDTMDIAFEIGPKSILFNIYNKLNTGLKISWDDISISINGKSYRVVHKETGVNSYTQTQPPTTIPPKSKLSDGLLPSENIGSAWSGNSARSVLVVKDLFPNFYYNKKDKAAGLMQKGTKIIVFFPYSIDGKYCSAYYDISITNVQTK